MNIEQFRYDRGNLAYLLWSGNEAIVIDGGAVKEILTFLSDNKLRLKIVTNTHGHDDHTSGNKQLLDHTKADFIAASDLNKFSSIQVSDENISVISTPGHTMDSIVFSYENILITGDTLFNGTVGNCYSGNYELYFQSLKKITELPEDSIIYAGHDLVKYSTDVIKKIDPENKHLKEYVKIYRQDHVFSILSEELKVNPFIRFNDQGLDSYRATLKNPLGTDYERWLAMMTVH